MCGINILDVKRYEYVQVVVVVVVVGGGVVVVVVVRWKACCRVTGFCQFYSVLVGINILMINVMIC